MYNMHPALYGTIKILWKNVHIISERFYGVYNVIMSYCHVLF